MRILNVTPILGGLLLALAASSSACAGPLPPPVTAISEAQTRLIFFVDPDVTVGEVQDERGRELLGPFHDALSTALFDGGYKVVNEATAPHDLTVHVKVAKVGYNAASFSYGPWGDRVAVDVTSLAQPVTHVTRKNLNWVALEGADTPGRLKFAARSFVNAISRDPAVEEYAKSRAPGAPIPAPPPSPGPAPAAGGAAPSAAADAPPK